METNRYVIREIKLDENDVINAIKRYIDEHHDPYVVFPDSDTDYKIIWQYTSNASGNSLFCGVLVEIKYKEV